MKRSGQAGAIWVRAVMPPRRGWSDPPSSHTVPGGTWDRPRPSPRPWAVLARVRAQTPEARRYRTWADLGAAWDRSLEASSEHPWPHQHFRGAAICGSPSFTS